MVCDIVKLEGIQRSFTAKITGLQSMNYWERIKHLGLYSLQRRRERFCIIPIWKIYNKLIPNELNLEFVVSERRGPTCLRRIGKSRVRHTNTIIFNSFPSHGAALLNVVPEKVKSIPSLTEFKSELDKWLQTIPDTPPTHGYVAANKNSLLEWNGSGYQL